MTQMTDDSFGAVPEGMRWCSHCNGYGSSLKEAGGRCSHCAGTGLVVDEAAALSANEGGNGSAISAQQNGG